MEEYINQILEGLNERVPEGNFESVTTRKNNNVIYHGIMFHKDNDISPIFYVDPFYQHNEAVETVVCKIIEKYNCQNDEITNRINTSDLSDVNNYKDMIVARVFNKDRNRNIMVDYPYVDFGDMIITFHIDFLADDTEFNASAMISNKLMQTWNMNTLDLLNIAYKNTKKLHPYSFMPIANIINEILSDKGKADQCVTDHCNDADFGMYVLTNEEKRYGAFEITNKETLLNVAKQVNADTLYILPSSVHELIIIPKNGIMVDPSQLLVLVIDTNKTCVAPEEVLADNVYIFNVKDEELSMLNGEVIPFVA